MFMVESHFRYRVNCLTIKALFHQFFPVVLPQMSPPFGHGGEHFIADPARNGPRRMLEREMLIEQIFRSERFIATLARDPLLVGMKIHIMFLHQPPYDAFSAYLASLIVHIEILFRIG